MRVRTVQDEHQWNPTPPMTTVMLPALSIPNTPCLPSALDQWPHCLNKFNPPPPPPPPAWAGPPIPPYPSPAYYPHSYPGTPYTTPQRKPGTYPFVPIHLPPHTPAARPMIPPGPIPRYQPQAEWSPPVYTDSLNLSIGQNDSGSGSSPGTRPPIRRDTSTKGSKSAGKRKNGATPSGETGSPVPEKDFPRTGAAAAGNTAPQSFGASTATAAVPAAPSTQSGPTIYGSTAPEYVYTPISMAQPGSTLSSRIPQLRIPSPPTQSQSTATQSVPTAANTSNSAPQLSTDASNAPPGAFNAPTQSRTPTRQSPPATDTPTIQITMPTPPMTSPQPSISSPSLGTRSGTPQYGTPVQHIYARAVRHNQSATFTPSSSLPSLTTPSSSFTPISFDSPQFYRSDNGWDYYPRREATSSVQSSPHSGSSPQSAHISPVPTSPTPSAQPTPPPRSQNPLHMSSPRLQTAFSTTTSPRSNASSTPDIILQPPSSAGSYDEFHIHAPSPLSPASALRGVLDNPDLLHPHYVSPRLSGRRMDGSTPSSGGQAGPQFSQAGSVDAMQTPTESHPRSNPSERDQIRLAMLASYENLERLSATYEQMSRNPSPLDDMLRTPGSASESQNRPLAIHPVLLGPRHSNPTFEWDMRFNPDELNITDEPAIQATPGSLLQISCASNIPVLRYLSTIWGPIETSPDSVNTVLTDIFNFLQTPLTAPERRLWIQFKTEYAGQNEEVKRYYEEVLEPRNGTRRVDVASRGKMFTGLVEDEILNDSEAGVHKFLLSL